VFSSNIAFDPYNGLGVRIEREILLLDMRRDELGDELTTDLIAKREMAMDKEFVRLIQLACKKDNIPRAVEVTKLLHHTVSFDMAIKVAEFYHLVGLREKIEILKADREQEDRLVIARDKRRQWAKPDRPPRSNLAAHNSPPPAPKPLQDYSKPPAIPRPGLARVTPNIEHTQYSSAALAANAKDNAPTSLTTTPESKRKRGDEEDSVADDSPKRRAFDALMAPPKPARE
jgi:chromosome transmission fidelity protein 4